MHKYAKFASNKRGITSPIVGILFALLRSSFRRFLMIGCNRFSSHIFSFLLEKIISPNLNLLIDKPIFVSSLIIFPYLSMTAFVAFLPGLSASCE